MLYPTCAECDDLYPEGAVHESCAEARIYDESGGWLLDRGEQR